MKFSRKCLPGVPSKVFSKFSSEISQAVPLGVPSRVIPGDHSYFLSEFSTGIPPRVFLGISSKILPGVSLAVASEVRGVLCGISPEVTFRISSEVHPTAT